MGLSGSVRRIGVEPELVAKFDASDKRLCQLADTDVSGFLAELGPQSELGPAYCASLEVAGIRGLNRPGFFGDPFR